MLNHRWVIAYARKPVSSLDKRFQVGDRCRLSELGRKRNPKRGIGLCEVVSFGNSSQRIRIRFVGYRSVHTMHASYLERVPEISEGWRGEPDISLMRVSTTNIRCWKRLRTRN